MRDACIARAAWALGDWRVALRAILAAHGHDAPRPDWAGHLLQTILLRHAGRAAWVPPALASTLDRFGAASIAVLQGEAPTAVERPAGVTWMALGMLFYDTRLKVIEVAGLDPERRREVAAQYGLSPEFLDIAAGGHQAIATACYARFPDLPFADDPWLNVRIKDIAAAARLGVLVKSVVTLEAARNLTAPDGRVAPLSGADFDLLHALVRNGGRPLSRMAPPAARAGRTTGCDEKLVVPWLGLLHSISVNLVWFGLVPCSLRSAEPGVRFPFDALSAARCSRGCPSS
jgi:hypothetical protein